MPGPTSLRDALTADAPAAAVNDYLRALIAATDATCHCWFRGDRLSLRPAIPRRKGVSASALEEWQRLLDCCSRLPHDLRRLQHDEDSVRLLHRLATHPADAVRFPAALALAVLSQVPPLAALQALRERGIACRPPSWWRVPAVAYRAVRWEHLCVTLAEHLYGEVAAGMRNETRCVEGIVPDIAVGAIARDDRGLILRAEVMIDAKSGGLPREHSYAHLCDRLEYWHARRLGEWCKRGGPPGCEIIYRDVDELASLAPPELAAEISEFASDETLARLYLRFLEDRALTPMDRTELAPTLEAPRR